jgi:hypothetical protein
MNYKGTWNAAANTPAIPAASNGNKGWFYIVDAMIDETRDGPYRYRWEAQEEADKLNGKKSDDA